MVKSAIRGAVLSFKKDPFIYDPLSSYIFFEDALVVMENGKIVSVETYSEQAAKDLELTTYHNSIICAGFIDCHVHYPQTEMIASFGEQLLTWLTEYTFVAEQNFKNKAHADEVAKVFFRELLRAGTTTAAVYCTVHPESVDAFFEESERYNTRMIAGKVWMDRNAPKALLDTAQSAYDDSLALIKKWHQKGRQLYSITPRFAPTSTPKQLELAGKLWQENPGTYMQTHLNENIDEIKWVKELFPKNKSYLDVYEHYGLTGKKAIFGHAIHMQQEDFETCYRTGSTLAHCPTSNLFLGSGCFKVFDAKNASVKVGLATDLGAGTSFSQLTSLNEAYKISALNGTKLTALHSLYLATKGGAEALSLEDTIGSVEKGYEADLVVLDLFSTPIIKYRMEYAKNLVEQLFILTTLADDRAVRATYVSGQKVYDRENFVNQFNYAK